MQKKIYFVAISLLLSSAKIRLLTPNEVNIYTYDMQMSFTR